MSLENKIRWAVFASGEGSNFQNFIDLIKSEKIKNQAIVAFHCDKECRAKERIAESKLSIASFLASPKEEMFTERLLAFLKEHQVDRIFLMGYMRVLKSEFLSAWKKPIVNIHPSVLPLYPGLNAIEQAIAAGDKEMGVTIHEVIEKVDAGLILKQASFFRKAGWGLPKVKSEVHALEHRMVKEYLLSLEALKKS